MTIEQLKPLVEKKLSAVKIAKELKTSETNIRYWCKKLGLTINSSPYTKYKDDDIKLAVINSISFNGVLRNLGIKIAGGAHANIKKRILELGLDISHFTHSTKSLNIKNKYTADEILVNSRKYRDNSGRLRRALREIGREYKCEICSNNGEWFGKKLTLQVDHKDGDWSNNERENLRFLCPNCHNQTDNFGTKKFRKRCIDCGKQITGKSRWCRKHSKPRRIRKVINRPDISTLLEQINQLGYVGTGKIYGVSDNAIRKWIRSDS